MPLPKSKKTKDEAAEISRENGKKKPEVQKKLAYPPSDPMVVATDLADMHADIYDPRAKIDPELKIHAACCYMMTGTVTGTAKLTGLDHRLISEWKNKSQWWDSVLAKVKKEKQDELEASLSEVIHSSADALIDRLQNGEEVIVKEGNESKKVKKQLSGRDVASILNTVYDKRSMLRGDPTSITRKETASDVLSTIRDEMEKIADDRYNVKVIDNVAQVEE